MIKSKTFNPGNTPETMNDEDLKPLLFEVDEVPVQAQWAGHVSNALPIPTKKALINHDTGQVLGVVGKGYCVVTNRQAIDMAFEVCAGAFPDLDSSEWMVFRHASVRSLSHVQIDLVHRAHVMNLVGSGWGPNEQYSPMIRVINSFNTTRALRFDFGLLRLYCSNGVILEEQVAQVRANHDRRALRKLRTSTRVLNLKKEWQSFMGFLEAVRDLGLTVEQSLLALERVLGIARESPGDKPLRQQTRRELWHDIEGRLAGYRIEVGKNAYAVFNTLTDLAARPPRSPHFRKDRQTLEKRAGAWLKNLATGTSSPFFNMETWLEETAPDAAESAEHDHAAENPWDQINWEEGLPEPRQFRDDELPLNKDKRYALSVDPSSLRDPSGKVLPLKARQEG